jgi:flagellar motility protein MotE (MotC chaperone)
MRSAILTALGLALVSSPSAAEPPAIDLSARAICDELRAAAATPRDLDLERARLKKEAAAVEAARQELKVETARLLELIAQAKKPENASAASRKASDKPKPQLIGLAKTVSNMKPAKSAAVMAKLPQLLAVSTLEQLEPARRAAILEKMAPDRAAEMLHALSEFKKPEEDKGAAE